MSATRGVIVQANPLAASGSVYPTQHNTTHARTRTHACAERKTESVHAHTHIRVKRTHLHVEVSHSCKPVCDSVHVPAQAMNPINPGAKWWKEPSLIAFFGWLTVVVLYAILLGFHNTYAGDFGTFVTFHGGTPGVSETSGSR